MSTQKTSKKKTDLSKVQDLYLLQMELWQFLDEKRPSDEKKKLAKKKLQSFKTLLKEVDWRYMGGEDVYESLQWIPDEVSQKLTPKKSTKKK